MDRYFLLENIKRFNARSDELLKSDNQGFWGIWGGILWISEVYCFFRFGASPDDYFRYEFYRKSNFERNKFITYRRSKHIIKKYNASKYTQIFQDKATFNTVFNKFIKRDWLDLRDAGEDEFRNFVRKNHMVLMKPLNGGQGQGIFKLTEQEMETMQYSEYRNYICEELICQNHIMDELHKKSVNTVRVLTFRGEIVACALRIGGGDSVVDNLHSNGVCAHLDIDTGIVDAPCIDNHLRKYLYHPDSHKLLIGFEVPNWNICCECVREAAKVVPQVQYVGWDVAILENDVAIIEGNHDPGHDVVQMIAQTGLYDRIREKS